MTKTLNLASIHITSFLILAVYTNSLVMSPLYQQAFGCKCCRIITSQNFQFTEQQLFLFCFHFLFCHLHSIQSNKNNFPHNNIKHTMKTAALTLWKRFFFFNIGCTTRGTTAYICLFVCLIIRKTHIVRYFVVTVRGNICGVYYKIQTVFTFKNVVHFVEM